MFIRFKDRRDVFYLSSSDEAFTQEVNRFVRGGREEVFQKPSALLEYNQGMGGVDTADGLMNYYPAYRKSYLWFKKLGLYTSQRMLLNAKLLNE